MFLKTWAALVLLIVGMVISISPVVLSQDSSGNGGTEDSVAQISSEESLSVSDSTDVKTMTAGSEERIYPMSEERKSKLIAYSQFRNIWRFLDFFMYLAILLLILFTGFSAKLRNWAQIARNKILVLWLYLILFTVSYNVLYFPLNVYREYLVESEFGFINQSFGQWFGEYLLTLGIFMVVGIVPLWLLYVLIERVKHWWLWFSIGLVPLLILAVVITPVFIAPLFNKFEPLKDQELRSKILTLASQAQIEGSDVFEVNASKQSDRLNAYVFGLFGTKRIVLYDTMIDNFTHDELRFVMAHEMAHYVRHHVWQGIFLSFLFILGSLWITNKAIHTLIARYQKRFGFNRLADVASLPLLMVFLALITFFLEPIGNSYSRYMEHGCDVYAMDLTGVDGETAATTFDKLSVYNLSDPEPHPFIEFWFYDHPALKKRMEFVRNYRH